MIYGSFKRDQRLETLQVYHLGRMSTWLLSTGHHRFFYGQAAIYITMTSLLASSNFLGLAHSTL